PGPHLDERSVRDQSSAAVGRDGPARREPFERGASPSALRGGLRPTGDPRRGGGLAGVPSLAGGRARTGGGRLAARPSGLERPVSCAAEREGVHLRPLTGPSRFGAG